MGEVLRVVSVSGGKDSTALYCWCIEKFGKDGFVAVFADTDHEHPVTLNYLRNLPEIAGGPDIHWVKRDFSEKRRKQGAEPSGNSFLDMILWKGRVPSRRAQFCTEHMKIIPIREYVTSIRGEQTVVKYLGMRAGESEARSKLKRRRFDKDDDAYIFLPLLRWSEADIFDYLKAKGVPPNPLYAMGFGRVGCFPCVNAGKRELSRLPDWAWDRITSYENQVKRTWFPWGMIPPTPEQSHLLDALPRSETDPRYPERVAYENLLKAHPEWMPTVAQVREWSKTTRGGLQFDLLGTKTNDVPSCMSTWAVCE